MRRIGVLTSDFELYHDLVNALRRRDVAFTSLSFGESPDPQVGVLLTSWRDSVGSDLPEGIPVVVVPVDPSGRDDVEAGIAHALRALEGVQGYAEVVVGIDPGHRPGVALLADGRLLQATQVFRVRDVAPLVQAMLRQYPADRGVVRVGHGAPKERDEILRALWPLREEGVRIEVVDETGTTPVTGAAEWPPDVAAAILIARTPGPAPALPPRPRLKPGQLREVQRTSRLASGGRFTLSRQEAESVARGERTLSEALAEREASRKRENRPASD